VKFKTQRRERLSLDITPLIDVVFLLLIFFMVSSSFEKQSKLKVDLPEASAKTDNSPADTVVIGIDEQGRYYVNDRSLVNTEKETLKLALIKTIGDKKDMPLVLRADADAPHKSVVKAMDVAAQLGLTRMSIATLESGSK
jgi:biopolymer transport protein ExbD